MTYNTFMTDRVIGIGETSSFRYFGVMPPIDEEAVQNVIEGVELPWWVGGHQLKYANQVARDDCPAHTEFGIDVGDALDWRGREVVDEGAVQIAQAIANILASAGDTVAVYTEVVTTDFQTPIFGEGYEEQRSMIQHFSQT